MRAARLFTLFGSLFAAGCATASSAPSQAASVPAVEPAVADPWAGCTMQVASGTVRIAHCGQAELRFVRAGQYRGEAGVRFMMKLAKIPATSPPESLDVDGRPIPVTRSVDGPRSVLGAAPRDDILALCACTTERVASECEPRLRWVARHGLPGGMTFPDTNMSFMGVALHVPEGCHMEGTERIACGKYAFDWRESPHGDASGQTLDKSYEAAGLTVTDVRERACTASGLPGRGQVFQVTVPQLGQQVTIEACAVEDGQKRGVAACIGAAPEAGVAYPAPCNQVFSPPAP
jgi:hypothetical protein